MASWLGCGTDRMCSPPAECGVCGSWVICILCDGPITFSTHSSSLITTPSCFSVIGQTSCLQAPMSGPTEMTLQKRMRCSSGTNLKLTCGNQQFSRAEGPWQLPCFLRAQARHPFPSGWQRSHQVGQWPDRPRGQQRRCDLGAHLLHSPPPALALHHLHRARETGTKESQGSALPAPRSRPPSPAQGPQKGGNESKTGAQRYIGTVDQIAPSWI